MTAKLAQEIAARNTISETVTKEITPQFYYASKDNDQTKLEKLLADHPNARVHDTILSQLTELFKIRNPEKNLSPDEIEYFLSTHTGIFSMYAYGVWVYYPWLDKLIHILDEDEFIEVRTNRNQHKITGNELAELRQKKIGIIGLSVGQAVALTIATERICGEIRIADFDELELSNLNRIKTGLYNVGIKKTVQLAREIAELDPFIKVICYHEGITENNIDDFLCKDEKLDLLIEECDSLDIKILSRSKAKEYRIPVVMETNDRCMVDIERFDLQPDYPLLHNLAGDIQYNQLKDLTTEQKIPVMLKLVGLSGVSARGKVTLIELGQTLSTWPQLASSVILGGGVITDVARRILLNQLHVSGRFYADIEKIIQNQEPPPPSYTPPMLKELSMDEMIQITESIHIEDSNSIYPDKEIIRKIAADAGAAPSSGNDQPWKFLFRNGRLYLFHEEARSYSFGDYRNMASYISLGAAIENVVLSTHYHTLEIRIKLFPDNNKKCIAVFTFKTLMDDTAEKHAEDALYDFIRSRCTNRKIIPNEAAPAEILQELKRVTESIDQANVSFITAKNVLQELGKIISVVDRIRVMHPHGHYDFFHREMRWSAEESTAKRNGMNISELEIPQQALLALQVVSDDAVMKVLRSINGAKAFANISVPNAVNAAAMGLITMPAYDPVDFINGGRAMQRQWLKSTQLGYAYQPLIAPLYLFPRVLYGDGEGLDSNAIEELISVRKKFMRIFPGAEKRGEVFLFRIFKGDEVKNRSLRLSLEDILYFG